MEKLIRRIGLVAHDAMKKDLIEWVLWNSELLMGHKFYCTGTTGTLIQEALKEKHPDVEWDFTILKSGPLGGDQQMGSRIVDGEIDYLFVDMPPGTGDVPLTVFQSLPVDGIVIVTSPQDLVQMIVKKAANMAEQMNIPVLGIIENYSYVKCPDCGKEIKVFGESHVEEAAREMNVPVLGRMPIDMKLAEAVENEKFYEAENPYLADVKL